MKTIITILISIFAASAYGREELWVAITNDNAGEMIEKIRYEVLDTPYSDCKIVSPPGVSLEALDEENTGIIYITYAGYGNDFKDYTIQQSTTLNQVITRLTTTTMTNDKKFTSHIDIIKESGIIVEVNTSFCEEGHCEMELACHRTEALFM